MTTLTINATASQAARVVHAIGRHFGYKNPDGTPRDATVVEVQQVLIAYIKGIVRGIEQAEKVVEPLDLT